MDASTTCLLPMMWKRSAEKGATPRLMSLLAVAFASSFRQQVVLLNGLAIRPALVILRPRGVNLFHVLFSEHGVGVQLRMPAQMEGALLLHDLQKRCPACR